MSREGYISAISKSYFCFSVEGVLKATCLVCFVSYGSMVDNYMNQNSRTYDSYNLCNTC